MPFLSETNLFQSPDYIKKSRIMNLIPIYSNYYYNVSTCASIKFCIRPYKLLLLATSNCESIRFHTFNFLTSRSRDHKIIAVITPLFKNINALTPTTLTKETPVVFFRSNCDYWKNTFANYAQRIFSLPKTGKCQYLLKFCPHTCSSKSWSNEQFTMPLSYERILIYFTALKH